MESSEKILNNSDVLEAIFRYLDFKEHLKLIKICPQFEDVILHGILRSKCKNLHIQQIFPDSFLLQYNAVNDIMTECSLTPEEFHIMLHHSSMYIHKLELIGIRCLENIISFNYHHLTELALRGTVVEDTHLQQVAKSCINLQSFTLLSFTKTKTQSNIRANIFGEMKALNKLKISDISFASWNYFDVQQLLCLAHLKTLSINIDIRDSNDNKKSNNTSTDRVYNIENLTIGELPCLQFTIVCFIEDLIRFENLTKLSITLKSVSTIIFYDNFLTQINNACSKLCELSLVGCDFKFKEFPRMNNLMHLTLKWCSNIKFKNFDEIFRKLKLKSLSLVGVLVRDRAQDRFDYNYISNTLETLNIEAIADQDIVTMFCNRQHQFENVSKVKLLTYSSYRSQSTGLRFSRLSFPNLQELIMNTFHILSENILYLEHLKVLQFNLFDDMSWSYLVVLFKHPTLTHITITPFGRRDFEKRYEVLPKCEGLTTILEYLSLPSVVYERALSFWPSFRQRNKLLKLEIVDCDNTLKCGPVRM